MAKSQGNYSSGGYITKGYQPTQNPGNGYQPAQGGGQSTPPSTGSPVQKTSK